MIENMTYTAITIGPIYDTVSMTSSPAGLWAASYLFSHISRSLCKMIVDNGLVAEKKDILSPYFCGEDQRIDGIGRYHDRIVFKPVDEQTVLENVQKLFEQVFDEIAMAFIDENQADNSETITNWFKQYLQLHVICYRINERGNPILDCSQYLDAIELEKTFPSEKCSNPLSDLLDSRDNDRNIRIRNQIRDSFSNGVWPFPRYTNEKGEERLPDMEDITGRHEESEQPRRKTKSYYAIVQSDGDKFGKCIKSLESENEIHKFSKKCLDYCNASVELIKDYGGVPIYAGGDDLFFIAPLTKMIRNEDGSIEDGKGNILDLLVGLREIFEKEDFFGKEKESPTLSFGVVIRYYKYPLYEAFAEAYEQLCMAKSKLNNGNTVAISLQKHSGRTSEFILKDFNETQLTDRINDLINHQTDDKALSSIRTKVWEFKPLILKALHIGDGVLKNVFDNTFDNEIHKKYQVEINTVRKLFSILPESLNDDDKLKMLDNVLFFARFWGEKGDENDAETVD